MPDPERSVQSRSPRTIARIKFVLSDAMNPFPFYYGVFGSTCTRIPDAS